MVSNTANKQNHSSELPSTEEFDELAGHLLNFSERTKSKAALLYIHFSDPSNNTDPNQASLALEAIEHRLLLLSRDADIFAQVEEMSFVNLSIETSEEHIPKLIEKLKHDLSLPVDLADGSSISFELKIGSAQYPSQADNCQQLIELAKANSKPS